MSPQQKQPSKLAEVAKHPAAYVLMVVVGMLGYLLRGFTGQSELRTDDCKETVRYLQGAIAHKDSIIEMQALQKRVNDATIQQLPAVNDSLLRHK